MVSKKYTKDYRIEPYLDHKGRLRDRAVYCGLYFAFPGGKAAFRKPALRLTLIGLFLTLTVLTPMFLDCDYARQFYLVLPLVILLIPIYMLWAGLWRFYTAGERVNREHYERTVLRIPRAANTFLVMAALSAVCSLVFVFLGSQKLLDWVCIILSLARVLAAWLLLRLRNAIRMEALPAENLPAEPDKNS